MESKCVYCSYLMENMAEVCPRCGKAQFAELTGRKNKIFFVWENGSVISKTVLCTDCDEFLEITAHLDKTCDESSMPCEACGK